MNDKNSGDESSYAGRWVARLRGRIVAQGGTPAQVRRAALSRFKETPEVIFMSPNSPLTFSPLLDSVRAALPAGVTVYLVGGATRDAFLGKPTHDLDFAVQQGAIKLARKVADALKADFYPLDQERDTGRVIVNNPDGSRTCLDFAAFRGPDLEADLGGRDFTLNAIAMDLTDDLIHDPLGGVVDLKEKRLRACAPTAISDDPVRILRGIRLAAGFGFHILPETRKLMKDAAGLLENVSAERLRDEFMRILDGPQPRACVVSLDLLGALHKMLPELAELKGMQQVSPHVHDVWEHTLETVSQLESILEALAPTYNSEKAAEWFNGLLVMRLGRFRKQIGEHFQTPVMPDRSVRSLLFLAALLHDIAKPQAKKVDEGGQVHFWDHDQQGAEVAIKRARALVLSNDEIDRLERTIRNHMRIHLLTNRLMTEGQPPSRRAVYRFFRDCGAAGVDVCLLTLADLRATYAQTLPQDTWAACLEVVRTMLEAWFENRPEQVSPPILVDGNDLMRELSLQPGPLLGRLLEAIREAQAAGEVTTREQALQCARQKMEEMKRKR